jgi:molecular chaperone Hsp33
VLYRLFHEEGVRLEDVRAAPRRCTCTKARLAELLARFNTSDREHMSDEAGEVAMTCEYCNHEWRFSAEEIDQAGKAND